MYECIDADNNLYFVDEYCLLKKQNNHPKEIFCPFCSNKLRICAENSNKRTHFAHRSGESCIQKDYSILFNSTGKIKDKSEILNLKIDILNFSYYIFEHIKNSFSINITVELFIKILAKLVNKNVLKFSDITPELIPYIWINILGEYKNTLYLYTNSKHTKPSNKLWNMSDRKDIILCFTKTSDNKVKQFAIPINTHFLDNTKKDITISFYADIVRLDIHNALKIPQNYHEELLKNLFCKSK